MPSVHEVEVVERELAAWRESISAGNETQDHSVYRPEQAIGCACTLALLRAGLSAPDPFSSQRIEISVHRFSDGDLRSCHSFDTQPGAFAGDPPGHGPAVGALALEEWKESNIAAVWWRRSDSAQMCVYHEADDTEEPTLGAPPIGEARSSEVQVVGPPIPNNHLEPPLIVPVRWLWVHAQPRQLELLGTSP